MYIGGRLIVRQVNSLANDFLATSRNICKVARVFDMIKRKGAWSISKMTETASLSNSICRRILRHFALPIDSPPDLDTMRQLLARYTRTVPWESASRIARRARHQAATDCALLGADFWESHFASGSGGTCYESNYAFFALLRFMGYEGYLTINDMGSAIGCHSAIVIIIGVRSTWWMSAIRYTRLYP